MRQPALFFGHGSPMNALGGPHAEAWRALGETVGKPKGVVMVSAHWETDGLAVTAQLRPKTMHDFGGFPPELHAMQYPAPGSPGLAARVAELTGAALATDWGLDHGTWSVLAHVWPEADVPVVQLSLDRRLDARGHHELAKQLAPLRDEEVIIAGSGDFVHNLRTWKRAGGEAYDWAGRFNEAVKAALLRGDDDALIDWVSLAEDAQLSVPTDEHYLPLLYVAAQRGPGDEVSFFNDVIEGGSISMTGVRIDQA
ncbi:MAG: 4,5-DOPA dioxygenase extradiol [Alphaproteobacteria bacterium]|jgi:4,5-DOPA dioxygenase extradiol|nr:4,5-DOPA dioxygenase extradiol [Alphaproteobacteria bacterium]MBU2042588.1 4,5-DOPA dioxygenase extradiol [Alphaproteobacteria bacterium]MBU2124795.1 4,5-DOPA dioxygenase extradiol [Alphaproteobacteria bacterium]MBU2209674.1 4,5-DOPA dioxygenase extradiol [Alphaproteobacteria bacterium]MBU2289823.1 4,5-DOPA dioxygenase extradiol [Alphaproteobacteria bacterium]